MQLRDKAVMVTGGASGLGEATVRLLVERGARVTILDRDGSPGEDVAKELGDAVVYSPGDVTKEDTVQAAVDLTVERFGAIHGVVSCAGTGAAMRTISKQGPMPIDIFRMVLEVNLVGTFNAIRLGAAKMVENEPDENGERGVLVNTASIAAFDGQMGQAAYSASKGGIVGMTLPIARDMASMGIRCVTIAPGTFDTPLLAAIGEEAKEALAATIPFPKRLGKPSEFGALAVHILENPLINGETIRIDGALRMPPR